LLIIASTIIKTRNGFFVKNGTNSTTTESLVLGKDAIFPPSNSTLLPIESRKRVIQNRETMLDTNKNTYIQMNGHITIGDHNLGMKLNVGEESSILFPPQNNNDLLNPNIQSKKKLLIKIKI
jgi:hypothetical protein